MDGIHLILTERQRQKSEKGFDAENDDLHTGNQLSEAAICYLETYRMTVRQAGGYEVPARFPWLRQFWRPKPDNRIRELVKAGALIAAEIDRLLRQQKQPGAAPAKGWKRYRFKTTAVNDWRPVIYDPRFPCWCSGYAGDGSHAIMIAYLPASEDLRKYWPEAYDEEFTEEAEIKFSERFAKPDDFIES